MKKILIIDNFDSFTFNLYHLIGQHFDGALEVLRNNEYKEIQQRKKKVDALVISPGPKSPKEAGESINLIHEFTSRKPIFGVCLGMQCINESFGGKTIRASFPMHGKQTEILHDNDGIFQEIPQNIKVARYHSLRLYNIPNCLAVNAKTMDGVPMGIFHKEYQIHGVQFHPESFMTEFGSKMMINFLALL